MTNLEWMIALQIGLQVADSLTTYKIIKDGGVELNLLLRSVIARLGLKTSLIVKAVLFSLTAFSTPENWLIGLNIFYAAIVLNNVWVLIDQYRNGEQKWKN